MKLFKMQVLLTVAISCVAGTAQANWVTFDFPGVTSTSANGIDGDKIVGSYEDASGYSHGFLYDGTTWTTLDFPGMPYTYAHGIDGERIVGGYHGPAPYFGECFVYDGASWTALGMTSGSFRAERGPEIVIPSEP